MLTVVAFLVALGLLIAVHEYGHYRVAVACGVKVLRFSIGFGPTLFRWKARQPHPGQDTEFAVAALPLGGFVRMLDEREGPVDPAERHRAFNTQPLRKRAAIVAAGPISNLLLAVLLYALVSWMGVQEPKAILGTPAAHSLAADAGVRGGELVQSAGLEGDSVSRVRSFEDLRWVITRGALDGRDVRLELAPDTSGGRREVVLPLSQLDTRDADARLLKKVGVGAPYIPPVLGEVQPNGPAQRAGLDKGDIVRRIGGQPVGDATQLREMIRGQVRDGRAITSTWDVERDGHMVAVVVTPEVVAEKGGPATGRIAAYVGAPPEMLTVRRGPIEGLGYGVQRTWDVSALTLRMMGRMVIGQASIKNLSGPLTIADYAGKSASLGLTQYLLFLALISVSLGVLNLLPLPVLDGGHLMYYLWEAVTGRSISDAWMERLQRGGVAVLLVMMSVALFNDIARLFG
jgi:regulator of sigma E protease